MTATAPVRPDPPAAADERRQVPVRPSGWRLPVVLAVAAVVALLAFWLTADAGTTSTFALATGGEAIDLGDLDLPTRASALVLSLACVALAGGAAWLVARRQRVAVWLPVVFTLLWVLAFLVRVAAGHSLPFTGMLASTVLAATPLTFGALSGVLCERAGVVNIAIEGQLLAGAFLSAVAASLSGSLWLGLLLAPVAGVLVAVVLAVFTIRYVVDQIIVGVVLNVLVIGATGFLYSRLLAPEQDTWNQPGTFDRLPVPGLSDLPVLGPVLFDQTIIVYLMYVAVVAVHVALFRTRWGLRVRAVGEHPQAADTVGIRVNAVRVRNVLLGGAVAGLGGAYFTLGSVGAFGREMTAGQGFIALAAMIFGRWTPFGALGAALLFGFTGTLQGVLSILDSPIPSDLMLMAPYVVTIFAVAGLVGRVRAPAADGQPYVAQ